MKAVLYLTFVTNWKTTVGGLLCLVAVVLFLIRYIDFKEMVVLLGTGAGWAGVTAKDGVRDETSVAPENINPPTNDTP